MKKIVVIFSVILILGCAKTEFETEQEKAISQLEWLINADPDEDFNKAIEKADFRFIGLYSYALFTPRVNISCLNRDKDINPIKGTSDVILGYQHHKLIAIGNVYAEHYNSRMRIFLEEKGKFQCNS
jgi:hypothetical protein